MTPVQAIWWTLVLAPLGLLAVLVAFFVRRSAVRAGRPVPGWVRVVEVVGVGLVVIVAFVNTAGGSQ
ncbi:hypothetical protein [Streptomyces sp. NPDC057702]|uniref:hypothetical protein n=1 Tax=unclassified Streptomyces TaxID=2593676 RepID=UPI00367C8487